LLGYRDELLSLDCWQGCFHCEYTILAEGWFDAFRVCSFGQHEFAVVFSVHRLAFRFLFMFGMNLKEIEQKKTYINDAFQFLIGLQVQNYNTYELHFYIYFSEIWNDFLRIHEAYIPFLLHRFLVVQSLFVLYVCV
jgi:hypothetical protein